MHTEMHTNSRSRLANSSYIDWLTLYGFTDSGILGCQATSTKSIPPSGTFTSWVHSAGFQENDGLTIAGLVEMAEKNLLLDLVRNLFHCPLQPFPRSLIRPPPPPLHTTLHNFYTPTKKKSSLLS